MFGISFFLPSLLLEAVSLDAFTSVGGLSFIELAGRCSLVQVTRLNISLVSSRWPLKLCFLTERLGELAPDKSTLNVGLHGQNRGDPPEL